ncbi:uncharacterized protein LOC131948931 [Physella acuta]|uniref:uncharacterized protein LOC131948931 n=1 Tax=Physella acuta TaxID=109671 RepID=UPI0027DDF7B5|nr:uncharacterized protein LOC131948931 [Physella acuta]XP_059166643.1 uncharacterized protein LOC131948931 [Physella acuta]
MANPNHEANPDDMHEIWIVSPLSGQKKVVPIEIMDVNGDDNKVRVVKKSILNLEAILNPQDYTMVACMESINSSRQMDDNASILDYFTEMCNGYFEFSSRISNEKPQNN